MEDQSEDARYIALRQVIYSVVSATALQVVVNNKLSTPFPMLALGFTFGCCVFGAIVYGFPQLERYRSYHRRAQFWKHCFLVPLYSTHFALVNNYDFDMSYLQLVLPIFPLVANLLNDSMQYTLQDGVVESILALKAFIHFKSNNYDGLAFCASYTLFHFFIGNANIDLHTIGFFCNKFFIIKALCQ